MAAHLQVFQEHALQGHLDEASGDQEDIEAPSSAALVCHQAQEPMLHVDEVFQPLICTAECL